MTVLFLVGAIEGFLSVLSVFKEALADLMIEKLSPISKELNYLLDYPQEIDEIMTVGANKARLLAKPILDKTREIMGFLTPIDK